MGADQAKGLERASAVNAVELTKRYGDKVALNGVRIEVRAGEIFGVLGPNGAGKTTMMDILVGIQRPDTGSVSILGFALPKEVNSTRQFIGVMAQMHSLPPLLKVDELLGVYELLYEDRLSADDVLELIGLKEQRGTRVSRISMGQRQRLAFGLAIIGKPKLLFLDEPTTALDPQSRRFVWDFVRAANEASGCTTVLTTHSMEEAQLLCHRVMILDRGKVLAVDSPDNLVAQYCPGCRVSARCDQEMLPHLSETWGERFTLQEDGMAVISTAEAGEVFARLNEIHVATGGSFQVTGVESNSLEDVYLRLTGRELRN
jgi:ABC-2 type transport system ATP-binding protein